jgi:hypothetical protein
MIFSGICPRFAANSVSCFHGSNQLDMLTELAAGLHRVIAEAIAWASDPRMVQSSRAAGP